MVSSLNFVLFLSNTLENFNINIQLSGSPMCLSWRLGRCYYYYYGQHYTYMYIYGFYHLFAIFMFRLTALTRADQSTLLGAACLPNCRSEYSHFTFMFLIYYTFCAEQKCGKQTSSRSWRTLQR